MTTAVPDEARTIGEIEVREQLDYIRRALGEPDDDARHRIVAEAVLRFGRRLHAVLGEVRDHVGDDGSEQIERLQSEVIDVIVEWLGGARLSDREDEVERRAGLAVDLLTEFDGRLARQASAALLELPDDHPLRDLDRIRGALRKYEADRAAEGDREGVLKVRQDLLTSDLVTEEEGLVLVEGIRDLVAGDGDEEPSRHGLDADMRRGGLRSALLWHLLRVVGAREAAVHGEPAGDGPGHLAAARALVDEMARFEPSPQDLLAIGWALEEADQHQEAADMLRRVVDARSGPWRHAAWIEGLIRLRLNQPLRVIEVLEPIISDEERDYVLAIADAEVASAGSRFSKDATNLAFAYARAERWADALHMIERSKSARLRHAAKLRQSDAGRELLALEAELAATRRGAATSGDAETDDGRDPLGARVTRHTRLLEDYRRLRPELAPAALAPPSIERVAAELAPGEAVVCLAAGFAGLLVLAIVPGDRDVPGVRIDLSDLPHDRVVRLFSGSGARPDEDAIAGWMLELAARDPVDPLPALDGLLDRLDDALGVRLRAALDPHDIGKVTIVPHRVLHAVPFWALPSLSGLDVRVASSLAEWFDARGRTARIGRRAVAVGDPTLDLPLARAEASAVAMDLGRAGCEVELLIGDRAAERAIHEAMASASLLHFAGHGLSRPLQPLLSSLLACPDARWGWPRAGDPLARLARPVSEWRVTADGDRFAATPEGRLVEAHDESGQLAERRLEHARHGTLWGRYDDGRIVQCAELLTTSDVLTADSMRRCGLAFLGACESGRTLTFDVDEAMGLPASLRIAGAATVIATLWPVSDLAALVFARLFYRRLVGVGDAAPRVDVAALVNGCRADIARIERDDALSLLDPIAGATADRVARAQLEAALGELRAGPGRPFAHPYHWAAFAVFGCEVLELDWSGAA